MSRVNCRVISLCFVACSVLIVPRCLADTPATRGGARFEALRLAIVDLSESFGREYPNGKEYLARLAALRQATPGDPSLEAKFRQLRREALLANPLLDFDELMFLERKRGQLGLPTNHQCNACLKPTGYDNRIAVLSPAAPGGKVRTLLRPPKGRYVGEIDLHFDADRLLLTMPNEQSWQIHEIRSDGSGLRQVSPQQADVDNFDACYLPDGRIVFTSTASYTAVPCWHGQERACSLYSMNGDGSGMRQLCFDQDLDLHPAVLPNGQVIYSRWDYTGIMHIYLRPLMVMNPDGTAQRAVYGSNSYYPNSLYFPRGIPGAPRKLAAVLSGYHGVNRMGELVVLDTGKGWHEADGIVRRIGHRGETAVPVIRDNLVDHSWPKFLHPYPLSEKYFVVAAQLNAKASWGIYLADAFDNMLPILIDAQHDYFEPIPLRRTPKPPILPDRTDPTRDDALVYLHDVYAGPGLRGVPHGSVKRLRLAAYHFGYPGMAGPDKIGRGGPWEAMRILGTVPVYEDGSAKFRVPANVPLTIQPLDAEGKALAVMRSWYTAMPGETASCVGCHEQPNDVPVVRNEMATSRPASPIEPWYGPARGFDFEREVQPVLDQYCVGCHNGRPQPAGPAIADLRAERFAENYQGLALSGLGAKRLYPEVRAKLHAASPTSKLLGNTKMRSTPAYEALVPYIRRVNVEDYVGLHVPCEYHADTSELVQMLRKGHHGVRLDAEAWDRLVTWIDLNGPCHGTWGDACEVPRGADRRRHELARLYGGATDDPESVPKIPRPSVEPVIPDPPPKPKRLSIADWPLEAAEARRRQRAGGPWEKSVDLGHGTSLKLVRIPAGRFVMGSADGEADEHPLAEVPIGRDFWMATCEITNEQFRRFDPSHDSGVFSKRSLDPNGPGVAMNNPRQPAVRVSWRQATAFCRWLSKQSGTEFRLPTEAQWEYACRAGTSSPLNYGDVRDDFSADANLADASIGNLHTVTGGVIVLQDVPSDLRFNDRALATADVGSYRANRWGLFDMHGNAAEWTASAYRSYPYCENGRDAPVATDKMVVRGGSFYDRAKRCRSAFRLSYPAWQRVHNVGFRVVCEGL